MLASAASPRVRVGMLGTGHSHFSGKYKAMLDSPLYEIVGASETNAAAKAALQKDPQYSALKWLDEDAMLHDASIQLIVSKWWYPAMPTASDVAIKVSASARLRTTRTANTERGARG